MRFYEKLPLFEKDFPAPPKQNWWKIQSELLTRPRLTHWFKSRDASRQRQRNEPALFYRSKCLEYKELRAQWEEKTLRYCRICTEAEANTARAVYEHRHESTLYMRMNQKLDIHGMMNCTFCLDKKHYVNPAKRYPILITSSFLNGFRSPFLGSGYAGDESHVDSISIPGATIESLMIAFAAEYGHMRHSVDVCLAAGLNNFDKDSVQEMIRKYRAFKTLVLNRNDGSTFSICTLPMAPKLTDIEPSKEPGQGWTGGRKTAKMAYLNDQIKELNSEPMWLKRMLAGAELEVVGRSASVMFAPCFHSWGLDNSKGWSMQVDGRTRGGINGYRFADWREREQKNMLHFNDAVRFRAGQAVLKYFVRLYKLPSEGKPFQDDFAFERNAYAAQNRKLAGNAAQMTQRKRKAVGDQESTATSSSSYGSSSPASASSEFSPSDESS